MAKTLTITDTITITGDSLNSLTYAPTYTNTNAFGGSGPYNLALAAGANTVTAPIQGSTPPVICELIPSSTSTNVKSLGNVSSNWTNQPLRIAVANASTFVIVSTGTETISIMFA